MQLTYFLLFAILASDIVMKNNSSLMRIDIRLTTYVSMIPLGYITMLHLANINYV